MYFKGYKRRELGSEVENEQNEENLLLIGQAMAVGLAVRVAPRLGLESQVRLGLPPGWDRTGAPQS
mgnify:CR=1 FL=1